MYKNPLVLIPFQEKRGFGQSLFTFLGGAPSSIYSDILLIFKYSEDILANGDIFRYSDTSLRPGGEGEVSWINILIIERSRCALVNFQSPQQNVFRAGQQIWNVSMKKSTKKYFYTNVCRPICLEPLSESSLVLTQHQVQCTIPASWNKLAKLLVYVYFVF